jgi:hypothetical protein
VCKISDAVLKGFIMKSGSAYFRKHGGNLNAAYRMASIISKPSIFSDQALDETENFNIQHRCEMRRYKFMVDH